LERERRERRRELIDGARATAETVTRYLVHFDDGGSGMRTRDEPLEPGGELDYGGGRYRVMRVEPAPNPQAFGHVWAELIE